MNIVEYRAMKAEEAVQMESPKGEEPIVQAEQGTTANHEQTNQTQEPEGGISVVADEQNQTQTEPVATEAPTHIEVDGKQVPIEELKNGYMRQSDYTRKTQELASNRTKSQIAEQFYEAVTSNPEIAQQLSEQYDLPYVDPAQAQFLDLNNKYQDLLLEREVETLKSQYDDFDVPTVLQFAYDNKHENLEDAYLLLKARNQTFVPNEPVDVNSLKEQIRQELLAELQSNVDTNTIIQSGGEVAPVVDNTPVLSQQELKVARNLKMTPEEYVKWR